MIFSSPSKTFLCGEYAVLVGGSALVLTHGPRFTLQISHSTSEKFPSWLHPNSPAGRLFKKYEVLLKDFRFQFNDPHHGRGGFGASGAQFVTLYAFIKDLKNQFSEVFLGTLLKEFKELDSSNSSGCDVLAQWRGGIVRVSPSFPQDTQSLDWPFEDLEVVIIPTGVKAPTHDHLENIRHDQLAGLKTLSESVIDAFIDRDQQGFFSGLQSFSEEMDSQGLLAPHSKSMMKTLSSCPGFKLVKACGALGSDTLLLFIDKKLRAKAYDFLETNSFKVIQNPFEDDNSAGIKIESASW